MFRSLSVLFAKSTKKAAPPTRRKVLKRSPTKKPSRGGKQTRSRAGSLAKRKKTEAKEEKSLAVTSTHVDPETNMVRMVDISNKRPSYRLATAVATVVVPPTCTPVLEGMRQVLSPAAPPKDGKEAAVMEEYYTSKKGPLFATAVIAGTNAVKQCSQMIPFCHPIPIQRCSFTFRRRIAPSSAMNPSALPHRVVLRKRHSTPANMPNHPEFSILYCFCTVATDEYKTGVEMEALTGATVASLTLYDMLKGMPGAQEDGLGLGEAFLLAKRGGKNDFIKLLMSEPAQPGTEQKDTPQISPTPAAAEAAPKEDKKEAKTEEAVEEEEEEEPPAKATPKAKRPNVVKRSAPAAPEAGDETGAWWRSSRKEKRLQEMNPRRKYGDNARVVIPTAPEKKKPAGKAKAAEVVEEEEEEEPEEEEEEKKVAPTKGKGKAAKKGTAAKKAKAEVVEEEEEEEHEEEIEEEEEEVVVPKKKRASRNSTRKGRGNSRPAVEEEEEEEPAEEEEAPEEEEEEEEIPASLTKKKGKGGKKAAPEADEEDEAPPSKKGAASKKKSGAMKEVKHDSWDNETVVEEEEEEPAEEEEAPEEEEEEEEAPPPPPKKKKILRKNLKR